MAINRISWVALMDLNYDVGVGCIQYQNILRYGGRGKHIVPYPTLPNGRADQLQFIKRGRPQINTKHGRVMSFTVL